eukprot:2016687-Pyramimonas_sp.AAC.1
MAAGVDAAHEEGSPIDANGVHDGLLHALLAGVVRLGQVGTLQAPLAPRQLAETHTADHLNRIQAPK